jgi:dihydroflavonol-4-reductase
VRALVTGGSGFIGSQLIAGLASRGLEVRALLRKTSSLEHLEGISFERVEGDLSDEASLERAADKVDYVFHLAGAVTAPSREMFLKHNAEGTLKLARAVARVAPGLKRFIHVSSLAAAGPSEPGTPRGEEDQARPVSHYGESKLRGEELLLAFKNVFPITIIRPPMVYGPKDRATLLFFKTARGRIVPRFGVKHYSTIHVSDLVDGILQAALSTQAQTVESGEVFFLAANETITFSELMAMIARSLSIRVLEVPVPEGVLTPVAYVLDGLSRVTGQTYPLNRDKLNEIRPEAWTCSNHKAKRVLGFDPKFEFEAGAADAARWYRRAGWI